MRLSALLLRGGYVGLDAGENVASPMHGNNDKRKQRNAGTGVRPLLLLLLLLLVTRPTLSIQHVF